MILSGKLYTAPVETDGENTTEETITETTTTTTTTTTIAPELDREWEDLVLAGPSVVNYLGLFMVLTSRQDQVLTAPTNYTIKYILTPSSLRTTLFQIASSMEAAFQTAQMDLVRTRVSMEQIPDHIQSGLLLIKTAPKDLLSKLLPYTLRNVERAANEGSAVSKPTLDRFVSVGLLIEELAKLVNEIKSTPTTEDYLVEAKAYANDMQTQWELLISLFRKFSYRADITKNTIDYSFINPIQEAQTNNEFATEKDRLEHLNKLISATISIDQSSYLLDMMARTYSEISDEHMIKQIESNKAHVNITSNSLRAINQRQLWQNTVEQSVKVARLAQERQNQFAATSPKRNEEYATYLKSDLSS